MRDFEPVLVAVLVAAPGPFVWWIGRGVEVTHLAPLVAAVINRRSSRFIREPWMERLEAYLIWDTVISAIALFMAMARIRNLGFQDLTFFPGFLLAAWTIRGLRPEARVHRLQIPVGGLILLTAIYEGMRFGLSAKWVLAMSMVSAFVFFSALWELIQLILKGEREPLTSTPGFWFLSLWTLDHGMMLIFYPLSRFFLQTLSKEWILYPWLVTYVLGAIFNLVLSKTFLCLKPRSS